MPSSAETVAVCAPNVCGSQASPCAGAVPLCFTYPPPVVQVFGIEQAHLPLLVGTQLPKFTKEKFPSDNDGVRTLLDRLVAGEGNMQSLE